MTGDKPKHDRVIQIIEDAQKGNKNAFEKLYQQYLNPIYRFIFFQVRDKQEAEDLTSIVFVKAFEKINTYEDQGYQFSSWLYKIARNTVIDHWKRKKPIVLSKVESFLEIPSTNNDDFGALLDSQKQSAMLKEAITSLSEDQREVILLKYIDDLSTDEIAKITGKSNDAVRALSYRAIVELKKYFNKNGEK